MSQQQFVTCGIDDIRIGEPLPVPVFLYIDFRFITFRSEGDIIDRQAFDRIIAKKLTHLFLRQEDVEKFKSWINQGLKDPARAIAKQDPVMEQTRETLSRKMLDIFRADHPDRLVRETLNASKRLVGEVMKNPFAVRPLAQLQTQARSTVDHSVNVAILSAYLGVQTGYGSNVILEHLAAGGLLHDVGKALITYDDADTKEEAEKKIHAHPALGLQLLAAEPGVPAEVRMIVEQHHEKFNGGGFPNGLRGSNIYELARLVSIANVFDELVSEGLGTLAERQASALKHMTTSPMSKTFDPQKLEKVAKILSQGV